MKHVRSAYPRFSRSTWSRCSPVPERNAIHRSTRFSETGTGPACSRNSRRRENIRLPSALPRSDKTLQEYQFAEVICVVVGDKQGFAKKILTCAMRDLFI